MEQYMGCCMTKMKRQLTPAEKIAILHEYQTNDISMDALSKKYGVEKLTVPDISKPKASVTAVIPCFAIFLILEITLNITLS